MDPKQSLQASLQTQSYGYLKDYATRRALAKDFKWFCAIYLPHYFTREPASFHAELMETLSDHSNKMLEVIGFRGSAKSTFASTAFILWAACECPDIYPFIIPLSDTTTQSKMNMANIKTELDSNWVLKNDYGSIKADAKFDDNPEPDLESDEDWQAQNVLLESGVRILSRSRGQKVRGLRHRESRPKLIVGDDVEDREWVKTKENRDKTDQWFRGEVLPARDVETGRVVMIGNHLHEDALMARIKKTKLFMVREYPLIAGDQLTWPALFPTQKSLDDERILMGEIAWQREMLMRIVPEEGQIITEKDITFYDGTPSGTLDMVGHGNDLAISKSAAADYTTDVVGEVRYDQLARRAFIYIRPRPMNAKLSFIEFIQHCMAQSKSGGAHIFFVEEVQYQKAAIEELTRNGLAVVPQRPVGDKRSRAIVASTYIKNGTVRFPRTGCEDLLAQIFGFGVESHDDLMDGLVHLIIGLAETGLGFTPIVGVDLGHGPEKPPMPQRDPLNADRPTK